MYCREVSIPLHMTSRHCPLSHPLKGNFNVKWFEQKKKYKNGLQYVTRTYIDILCLMRCESPTLQKIGPIYSFWKTGEEKKTWSEEPVCFNFNPFTYLLFSISFFATYPHSFTHSLLRSVSLTYLSIRLSLESHKLLNIVYSFLCNQAYSIYRH